MVLKSVLTRVDFPKPDSPGEGGVREKRRWEVKMRRTNDHDGKLEALSHTFTVNLVWEIGKANVAHKFLANDGGDSWSVARK